MKKVPSNKNSRSKKDNKGTTRNSARLKTAPNKAKKKGEISTTDSKGKKIVSSSVNKPTQKLTSAKRIPIISGTRKNAAGKSLPSNSKQNSRNLSLRVTVTNVSNSKRAHVIKGEAGWALKKQGAIRALKLFETQKEAIKGAKRYLEGYDIVVHNKDGSISRWHKAK